LYKFGYHGNFVSFVETSDTIFEFSFPENPTSHAKNYSIFAQNWNRCKFGLFLPKFSCHGYLENLGNIFEFNNPVNPLYIQKIPRNLCNFGLFLSKFDGHGNSFGALTILDSIIIW